MAQRLVYAGKRFGARPVGHDLADLDAALAAPADRHRTVMVTDGEVVMKARRTRANRWRLRVIEQTGPRGSTPFGMASTGRRGVDTAVARATLASFLAATDEWRTAVRWRRGLGGRSPFLLIPLVFFVGAGLTLAVQAATGHLDGWSWEYLPNVVVGVGMISAITMWAHLFLDVIRPALATRIGHALGIEVAESMASSMEQREPWGFWSRPGLWVAEGGTPARRGLVYTTDLCVLLVGAVLPTAVIGVGIVLAARPILA